MSPWPRFPKCFTLVAASLLLALPASAPGGERLPTASLWLEGPPLDVSVGEEFVVVMHLENATDAYGVDLDLSFDPSVLEVQDDDGGTPGTQITPGGCPSPDFVVMNSANNTTGTIDYAAASLMPTPPCNAGTVATVRFLAIGAGSTNIEFTASLVSDTNGIPIDHTATGATVSVVGQVPDGLYAAGPAGELVVGEAFEIVIGLSAVSDVFGIQMALAFDPAVITVLDYDAGSPGTQLEPGSCPAPDFLVLNAADNTAGTIDYAATQLAPTSPCNGGLVATVYCQAVGIGTAPVDFTDSQIIDPVGIPIPHAVTGTSVTVGPMAVDDRSWGSIKVLYK